MTHIPVQRSPKVGRYGEEWRACPMASMCQGMANRPPSLILSSLPGILMILFGVLIILEPKILAWLVALMSIFIGIILLVMARLIRRFSASFRSML